MLLASPMSVAAAHLSVGLKNQNRKLKGRFRHSEGWREWPLPFYATGSNGHNV
jgi:hypothetical protein